MAMRAIMKKIIISPRIRFKEGGGLKRVHASTTSSVTEDRRNYLNNEAVVRDLERILKDGKRSFCERVRDRRTGKRHEINERWERHEINERWEDWVHSSHELWKKKNEEEQQRDLDMYWKYLKGYLHRKGIDTSNHGLLLSMKRTEEPPRDDFVVKKGEIVEFSIGSPDKGLISINRLVLDRDYTLPRQSVNGLLCLTTIRDDAFLIYNPSTGEKSPWIDIITNEYYNHIAFAFNPQSNEHKVIWISGSEDYNFCDSILRRPKDQVVQVFTVGKNTWQRIDATPPVSITYEDHFYLNGCIYWRIRIIDRRGEPERIMVFDVATEKFRVIPIPNFVVDTMKTQLSQSVELIEIDGSIAVLKCTSISLWIIHEDADGNVKWTKEYIKMPCGWNGNRDLSIEALRGTDIIFLRPQYSDSIFYYNRKSKESVRFPIAPNCGKGKWGYEERIIQV